MTMTLTLNGRVALVTGGSKSIGKSIAFALGSAGAKVSMLARSQESLNSAVGDARARGIDCVGVRADVTHQKQVDRAVDETLRAFGGIDILICSAGGAITFGGLSELTDEDWLASFQLNLLGIVHCIKASERCLIESKSPRVVIISSISGIQPGRYNPHYTTMKAATLNLCKFLASNYADKGILVNAVCPGPVRSDSWNSVVHCRSAKEGIPIAEAFARQEKEDSAKIPLGRIGECDDVSPLVTFLCTEAASWTTGACFRIDGGKLASIF